MGQNYVPKIYKRPPAVSLKPSQNEWVCFKDSKTILHEILENGA